MSSKAAGRGIKLVFWLIFIGAAAWLVLNRQAVIDWWRLSQYAPSAAVVQLADNSTMQGRGRDLFYVSDPQIQDSKAFNASCGKSHEGEQTIVLGCYTLQQIFLYNVTDARLAGVKEVTAAHEMLHAAYERLSSGERAKVDAMLKPIIDGMTDARILHLISLYNKEEPGQLYNEMHSILGTEYTPLTPELEAYYKQYFADRSKVVTYAQSYQGPFVESQNRVAAYEAQLSELKTQIDQNNSNLQSQKIALQAASDELDNLRSRDAIEAYNQAVPPYNAKVDEFNALLEQTKALIARYNNIVVKIDAEAAAQKNLYQSLDSNYQPATQN